LALSVVKHKVAIAIETNPVLDNNLAIHNPPTYFFVKGTLLNLAHHDVLPSFKQHTKS
jgi:hypothetical protein